MIVAKSVQREAAVHYINVMKKMATVIPQCTGLYFQQNRSCDYYDYAESLDCHF